MIPWEGPSKSDTGSYLGSLYTGQIHGPEAPTLVRYK